MEIHYLHPSSRFCVVVWLGVLLGSIVAPLPAEAEAGSSVQLVERARSLLERGRMARAARVIRHDNGFTAPDPETGKALRALLEEARSAVRTAERPKRADAARTLLCTVRYRLTKMEMRAEGATSRILDGRPRRADDPEITPPERLYRPMPQYTEAARDQRYQGAVVTQLIIDEEGCVASVKAIADKDYELEAAFGLVDNTIETQLTWVFRPARLGDKAVVVYDVVTTSFLLQ